MTKTEGTILAVCQSERKGVVKKPVEVGRLIADFGLEGDAHGGMARRQVSLLSETSIEGMRQTLREKAKRGEETRDLAPGDFAENLTIAGCVCADLPLGARVRLQRGALLEITQIGKECHDACEIRRIVGDCVMPREGVFARVVEGGEVRSGDTFEIEIVETDEGR